MCIVNFHYPLDLIMLQPDLGTGMVLVLSCMVMIFVAGATYFAFFRTGLLAFWFCAS